MTLLTKHQRWFEIAALVLIIAVGVLFRLDDLGNWRQFERRAFFDRQPIHTTFDAWFYLSLSQDLLDGTYLPVHEKRGVPDSPPRPAPPPLISVMAAGLAQATGFSLSWIGALLPVVLAPLLVVPLYLLGRFYGGPLVGFAAALLAPLSPIYVLRSNIGRFDTDCLNVIFTVTAALFFLYFGIDKSRRRYLYFSGGLLVYGLFLWWWDQASAVVSAITLLPLAVALAFFYRPARREGLIFLGLFGGSSLIPLLLIGPDLPLKLVQGLWSKFLYISKDAAGFFPNTGVTLSEQMRPSLPQVIAMINGLSLPQPADLLVKIGYSLPLLAALAGILLLCRRQPRASLFLIALAGLAAGSFFANRFLLFLPPLFGLGIGYFLLAISRRLQRYAPLPTVAAGLLLLLLLLPLYLHNRGATAWPKESGPVVAGMAATRDHTPPEAIIWAWWDHGYALNYYAKRATVNDGSVHNGERTVYNAIPLVTESYRLAANFIQFYAARGSSGMHLFYQAHGNDQAAGLRLIKEVLAAGPLRGRHLLKKAGLAGAGPYQTPDQWLEFFFPAPRRPVYLFLDDLLLRTSYWWYWFGSWDIDKHDGRHPFLKSFYDIRLGNGWLTGSRGLRINTTTGEMFVDHDRVRTSLSRLSISDGGRRRDLDFGKDGIYRFALNRQQGYGACMDRELADSVFSKLFIQGLTPDRYFRPVTRHPGVYQLWEVQGDIIRRDG